MKEDSNASNHDFVGIYMQILKRFKVSLLDCIKSLRMHDVQSVNIIKINMCLLCNIVRWSFWVGNLFLHPLLKALLLSIHHPWAKRARETSRIPMFGHEHLRINIGWFHPFQPRHELEKPLDHERASQLLIYWNWKVKNPNGLCAWLQSLFGRKNE